MRHAEKSYCFSDQTKKEAVDIATEAGEKPYNVHHIFPRFYSRKYHLDSRIIKSLDNAIALDRAFHTWIHEVFTEEDYIFLGVSLLGLSYDDFTKKGRHETRVSKRRR
jgi:hypothetical protein